MNVCVTPRVVDFKERSGKTRVQTINQFAREVIYCLAKVRRYGVEGYTTRPRGYFNSYGRTDATRPGRVATPGARRLTCRCQKNDSSRVGLTTGSAYIRCHHGLICTGLCTQDLYANKSVLSQIHL